MLWFKKCWPKMDFDMKYPLKVIQGHSFCNQLPAHNGLRIVIILLLAVSPKFSKTWPAKSPNIAVDDHPTLIWRPRQEEPQRISPYTLYFQKLGSLGYILSQDVWVYLYAYLCNGLQKTALCCNRVLAENGFSRQLATQSHSRSLFFCSHMSADKG